MEELPIVITLPILNEQTQTTQILDSNSSNQVDWVFFSFHNILVAIKLDEKNFTIWKHQIL